MKVDLHTHTRYSHDSTLEPAQLIERARAAGLDRVAVTDHNRMDGAFEAHAIDPSLIILGEEISCAGRMHLIGLFLHEPIPRGLTVEETAERIHGQGGIVYAPHPFAYAWRPSHRAQRVLEVTDVVEVFNGRAFYPPWNRRALEVARTRGLRIGAGSDSHFAYEIGGSWIEMPTFTNAAEFLDASKDARVVRLRQPGALVHVASKCIEIVSHLSPWRGRASELLNRFNGQFTPRRGV